MSDDDTDAPNDGISTPQPAHDEHGRSAPGRDTGDRCAEAPAGRRVRLKVRRQDGIEQPATRRWEEYEVPFVEGMTVLDALDALADESRTVDGKETAPVAYQGSCHEETCGACAMLIDGRARLACASTIREVAPKERVIVLEPLAKLPLIRDLATERSRVFETVGKVQPWIGVDGRRNGEPPRQSPERQRRSYEVSRCIECAACLEACPQFGEHAGFVGALAVNAAHAANLTPLGELGSAGRVRALMQPGGIAECGKAQNCVEVCPVDIPLVDAIGSIARDATKQLLFGWLR